MFSYLYTLICIQTFMYSKCVEQKSILRLYTLMYDIIYINMHAMFAMLFRKKRSKIERGKISMLFLFYCDIYIYILIESILIHTYTDKAFIKTG